MRHNLFNGRLIRLRALEPEDAETLFRFRQDSESLQHQGQMGWPYSLAELRFRLDKLPEMTGQGDDMQLAIETLDGQMVGEINIQLADPKHGTFAVGIALGERAVWGKGYAKEAMLLVLRFMFMERRYQKCNVGTYAFNERSLALYRKLGFVDEGRVRRNYFTNGAYHDEIWLGMLREEFLERYQEWMDK